MANLIWRILLLHAIVTHSSAQSLTGCHSHGSIEYCFGPDGKETPVPARTSASTTPPPVDAATTAVSSSGSASLSGCHSHGATEFCFLPNGEETAVTRVPSSNGTPATTTSVAAQVAAAAQTTAVTGCHLHATATVCVDGKSEEVMVSGTATRTGEPPAQFTDCHSHGEEKFCLGPGGEEVLVLAAGAEGSHSESETSETAGQAGQSCHFHAGVEHCVGAGESEHESASSISCELTERDYNKSLRIGTLFVMLVTSSIAVFGPILLTRFFNMNIEGIVFTVIKQFGTGVIISTALIHLLTHAQLMFANQCLGRLTYEATTSAIAVAGFFLSFLVEYFGSRIVASRVVRAAGQSDVEHNHNSDISDDNKEAPTTRTVADLGHSHSLAQPDSKLSVVVMEAGIIFHSTIIGVTLIVAGDSFFITLFIVIIFHQAFEGLALGARIASLRSTITLFKMLMAAAFALVTPIGMAIGLGVLNQFNGNDKSTIVAVGTLDALSAGILLWVGIVDMWSHDWLHGDLRNAGIVRTLIALFALVAGLVLMSFLGKWA